MGLPQLPEERYDHACAALPTTGALVVAGGHVSSVLTLLPGATAWTPLISLPRTLGWTQGSIVGGKLRVIGGHDRGEWGDPHSYRTEVLEYHPEPWNQWILVGNIQIARYSHATLSIGSEQLSCLSSGSVEQGETAE